MELLKQLFASSKEFKIAFTKEAMSGREKLKGEKTGRYRYWSALSGIIDPSKLKEEDLTEQGNTELPIDVDVVGDQSVNFNV